MPSRRKTELPDLTPGELEIMHSVWAGQPAIVSELTAAVNESRREAVSRTTVLKTIQRLEEKGWLLREPGRPARYRAARAHLDTRRTLLDTFRHRVFDGSTISLVRCLLDSSALTPEEIREMQQLIDRERKGAP